MIFGLKNPAQQLNWTEKPSPIPLMNRVESGGKIVMPNWTFQNAEIDKSEGTKLTLHFTCAAPKLDLRSEWWARPGPGPIHHAMFLTNQSNSSLKIFYQPTLAVQWTVPAADLANQTNNKLWMWYFRCDGGLPGPQSGVYRREISEKLDCIVRTHPDAGMIPLVVVDLDGRQGFYVGVEWSFGDIRLTGLPASNPPGETLLAGNVMDFKTTLETGQVFELPPGFLGAYDGDIDAAGNRLRKYLFRYNMPKVIRNDKTYPKVQWNAFGATGKQPGSWDPVESKYYPLVDDIAPLGFERGDDRRGLVDWRRACVRPAGLAVGNEKGGRLCPPTRHAVRAVLE